MKTFIFLTLFCLAFTQTPPEITESFLARFRFEYNSTSAKTIVDGEGTWARSEDVNAEEMELDIKVNTQGDNVTHHVRSVNLTTYSARDSDEYYVYEIDGKKEPCFEAMLAWPHELPHMWDWLKVAKNNGTRRIGIRELQVWTALDNGNSVAVYLEKDNTPYILEVTNGDNSTRFTFRDFRQEKPHDNHSFRIPEECASKVVADGKMDEFPSIISEWFQFVFWK